MLSTQGTTGVGTVGMLLSAEPPPPRGALVAVANLLWRRRRLRKLARRAEWAEQARRTPPLSAFEEPPEPDQAG